LEEFPAKRVIFTQGETGNRFYLIAHGEVDVLLEKKETNQKVRVKTLGVGEYFGEVALVNDAPRTATIMTATRSVLVSITKDTFQKFFLDSPESYADFAIKLSRYEVPLASIITHPLGLKYLTQYLAGEYSTENLHFYLAVKNFEKATELEKQASLAVEIFTKFVDSSAHQQVNIAAGIRETLAKQVKDGKISSKMFEDAFKEVSKLMAGDSLSRFKKSELFNKLLNEVGSYEPLREQEDDQIQTRPVALSEVEVGVDFHFTS